MAHRGVCPDMACELYQKRRTEYVKTTQVYKAIGKELGLPWRTIQSLVNRNLKMDSNESKMEAEIAKHETCTLSDFNDLVVSGQKFGTIYADPPWMYSNQATRSSTSGVYKSGEWGMPLDELAALPIPELTAEQAHLHLWTTNAFLPDALKIIEAWGFEYKGVFVWVKDQMGIGNYWRVSHEFLLLGVKGGLRFKDKSQKSWIKAPRTKHSVKPDAVAGIIEKVSPGPYLELFARRTRPDWTVWGNEIERTIFNDQALRNIV